MDRTVLILGANGRFGRHAKAAFSWANWDVQCYDRETDAMPDAAWGASLIVNAWNPLYPDWATDIPKLTQMVIDTAKQTGATVLIPGNVYPYGDEIPETISERTPHAATRGLSKIRKDMEAAYKAAGVKTIILRAGDFIDTEPSGNWYDRVITARIMDGKISYPGPLDADHAWAFLPDVAAAAVELAEIADALPRHADVLFPGYTLTGEGLARALRNVIGAPIAAERMSWLPITLAAPFWKMGRHLKEMRYLWDRPHRVTSTLFDELVPDFQPTPLLEALEMSLDHHIDPDQKMSEVQIINASRRPLHAGPAHA